MCKTDRENYEKYWDDISPFIKFGCLKDEKFGEKIKDSILFKNLDHKYLTSGRTVSRLTAVPLDRRPGGKGRRRDKGSGEAQARHEAEETKD